jgi:hypothetical protein
MFSYWKTSSNFVGCQITPFADILASVSPKVERKLGNSRNLRRKFARRRRIRIDGPSLRNFTGQLDALQYVSFSED